MRSAEINRITNETDIKLKLCLEGGDISVSTGIGFFDHMLVSFAKHSGFGLSLMANGDIYVDPHHTVEDVGIVLGKALSEALGDCKGIERFAFTIVPMDEALVMSSIDISGRGGAYLYFDLPTNKVGEFDTELVYDFFEALARNANITLHIKQERGRNSHHIIEASFKSVARSLKAAVKIVSDDIPSSKGVLK